VALLDAKNNIVPMPECASDFLMDRLDVVKELTSPQTGIALNQGEVYGREVVLELPTKKGIYRLQAQLTPASLDQDQERLIAQQKIRIVHSICQAPVVTITVK
jgi:hypothetical protein